jgi:NADPH:quinone reductase-like Zn-dependent oxidoreductase
VITIADYSAPQYGVRVTGGQDGRYAQALGEAAKLWQEGKLSVPVAQAFPFAQAADAHRLSEGGHVRGKLVLTPE